MLTPKYLEALPQPMIQLYSRLENEILEDIAKRITAADYLTPTAEWRLYKAEQLRLSSKQITAKLARLTGKSEKEIRKLYTAALKEALKNDEKIYRAAIDAGYLSEDKNGVLNSYFGSVAFSNALKAGLQNTNGLMRNLCSSTAASANRLLSDELDLAFMKVTSGTFTMDEAVFSAVKNLGKSGLTVVNYASGRKDKIDVAVRRAVITGIGQAAANVQLGLASDMGCNLVEVTAHLGARPTHQVWQGRIFSLSGTHPKYPEFRSSTGYGTGDGLCGWNCRHNFYPYFEGLSKPVGVPFTKEENDKVYRDTQKQRAYERAIRQSKRELAALDASRSAASDDALKQKLDREFQRKAVTLKRREAKLAEHLRASGLLPDNSRVRVDGFGRSVSGKAVWAAKKAESPNKMAGEANDWSKAFPQKHEKEEINRICAYANERNIRIAMPETFDGDFDMLREQIDVIDKICNDYQINRRIIVRVDTMESSDFGITKDFTIHINKMALRNRSITNQNLSKDNYLAANVSSGIATHEMGHILSRVYGYKGLDIAKKAYYNVYKENLSTSEMIMYIENHVSKYASEYERPATGEFVPKHKRKYKEIVSEMLVMNSENSNPFSCEFIRLMKEVIK